MQKQIEAIQTDTLGQISAAGEERSLDDARVAVLGKSSPFSLGHRLFQGPSFQKQFLSSLLSLLIFLPFQPLCAQAVNSTGLYDVENLHAWCIVPFDAKQRTPKQRAEMVVGLGLKRVAYDWRDKHVAEFEEEILQYQKHGIEFFAFWSVHPKAFALFEIYNLRPQIWLIAPNPNAATNEEKVKLAAEELLPVVEQTRKLGSKLALYNHGGWNGEPENLAAIAEYLRKNHAAAHVGIVYNFHHGHTHIENFAARWKAMQPYLFAVNLNGMEDGSGSTDRKILYLSEGNRELEMMRIIEQSGWRGPVGIINHREDVDCEVALRANLLGLDWLRKELAQPGSGGPKPFAATSLPTHAGITMTNTTNITLAASQTEVGAGATDNPEVTGGLAGPPLTYTASGSFYAGDYGAVNLNDGDIGTGNISDSKYAITNGGTLTLDFGTPKTLYGIAIYNGYTNRDEGTYTLKDGAGNILGAWTIATATGNYDNDGADSFWLKFNTPVNSSSLVLETTTTPTDYDSHSYREIQVFDVPPAVNPIPHTLIDSSFNFLTNKITLKWTSANEKTYRITSSTDLLDWSTVILDNIDGQATETLATGDFSPGTKAFFRVEEK